MQILSLSLLLPIAYLGILTASMATFSHLYRRRQLSSKLRLAPYFPEHTTRNVYLSLLHLPDQSDEKATKVPDSVLRAALLARACTDIERIMEIRTKKPALSTLLQRGVVGDEMFQRLVRAEQELEVELKDVVAEAEALSTGWGQSVFQSAGEMVQNRLLRAKLDAIRETTAGEKEKWEVVREGARRELMDGGVEEEVKLNVGPVVERKGSVQGSDEDAVLVDKDAEADLRPAASGGGGGGKKKKKNKNKNQNQSQGQAAPTQT